MSSTEALSRRAFLALGGALPFAVRGMTAAARQVPVGLELYSVRDALTADLSRTVRAVAKMGYEVVEFYAPYYDWTPQQAADVRKLLDDVGLRCHSTHNAATTFDADKLQKAIDLNQAIGSHALIMASPGAKITDADGWKAVADRLSAASERLASAKMVTGYHNHAAEWQPVNGGQRAMDIIAAQTPKQVVLQFDVGTCVEAGADPVAWITANPGRIKSVHCKDWARGEKGYSALFGEGDAPWKAIFEAAESTGGVEYYLIEQEQGPAAEQLQRAQQCLANWKKIKG